MKTLALPLPSGLLLAWLPFVVFVTVISGTIYTVSQQVLRQTANDAPTQLVDQVLFSLNQDHNADQAVPFAKVGISEPFVTVYDNSQKVLATSLDSRISIPAIPRGVLSYATTHKENNVTWQPAKTLRLATVTKHYKDAKLGDVYITGAQNLSQTEKHVDQIGGLVLFGWAVALAGTYITVWAETKNKK